jgi:hypothetical protein
VSTAGDVKMRWDKCKNVMEIVKSNVYLTQILVFWIVIQ